MTRFPYEQSRYPYPIPFGWYQVAWHDELPVGKAKALYYFGRHLVGWRDDDGVAHVLKSILAEADLLMAVDGYPTIADLRAAGLTRT